MKIKSLKDLRSKLEKAIKDSLEDEVYEMVLDTEISHTDTEVYSRYVPTSYIRRYEEKGLKDPANMVYDPEKLGNGILEVENVTKFNPYRPPEKFGYNLPALIEYGWKETYISMVGEEVPDEDIPEYIKPRPFISETKREIKEGNKFPKALKKGLKRNGIDVS